MYLKFELFEQEHKTRQFKWTLKEISIINLNSSLAEFKIKSFVRISDQNPGSFALLTFFDVPLYSGEKKVILFMAVEYGFDDI